MIIITSDGMCGFRQRYQPYKSFIVLAANSPLGLFTVKLPLPIAVPPLAPEVETFERHLKPVGLICIAESVVLEFPSYLWRLEKSSAASLILRYRRGLDGYFC